MNGQQPERTTTSVDIRAPRRIVPLGFDGSLRAMGPPPDRGRGARCRLPARSSTVEHCRSCDSGPMIISRTRLSQVERGRRARGREDGDGRGSGSGSAVIQAGAEGSCRRARWGLSFRSPILDPGRVGALAPNPQPLSPDVFAPLARVLEQPEPGRGGEVRAPGSRHPAPLPGQEGALGVGHQGEVAAVGRGQGRDAVRRAVRVERVGLGRRARRRRRSGSAPGDRRAPARASPGPGSRRGPRRAATQMPRVEPSMPRSITAGLSRMEPWRSATRSGRRRSG